jgi:hypothetical protein
MKYSYEKINDAKCYVWHTEGENKTLIAITADVEKAHFLATAANQYRDPDNDSELWYQVKSIIEQDVNKTFKERVETVQYLKKHYTLIKNP